MPQVFRRVRALRSYADRPPQYSLAELFHENTKLRRITTPDERTRAAVDVTALEAMACAYKRYRLHPSIKLPEPARPALQCFDELAAARRTHREFSSEPLRLAELSSVLQWSYGVTGTIPLPGGGMQPLRAAPSAGALYPGELYLGVRAVDDLAPGLYHYDVPESSLARLAPGDPTDVLTRVCCGQAYAQQAAVVIVITAVFQRTVRKYGDRGYRYALLDLGHVAQNLCLASTALDLAIVTSCGFYDDEAARFLGVDGHDEAAVYVAFIGRRSDTGA
jgi:SagB-type dehydrogenase family enzyme